MARYVMANRRAGKFLEFEKEASRAALDAGFNTLFAGSVSVVNDRDPADRKARRVVVFDADPDEISAKAASLPSDVMLEPAIPHFPVVQGVARGGGARVTGFDTATTMEPAAAGGPQTTVTATITGSGAPLFGAEAILFAVDIFNRQRKFKGISDQNGLVAFALPVDLQPIGVVILPAGGHWSIVVRNPPSVINADCPPIVAAGPLDWWHEELGITAFDPALGTGITVGVIDTGVGPSACLTDVVRVGAFIDGGHDPNGTADVDAHGSHVCGIIGGRPTQIATQRAGIAPGVTLMCARVFAGPDVGASQADIANALDELSRERHADLVNMSLGATEPSQIELDAIRDALQRGTLCICAAGNDAGAVNWPGAFAETVAVSAIGRKNTAPAGTLSAGRVPTDPAKIAGGNLFLANFSSFGAEITCTAPGVGIISTVPERFGLTTPYAAMDGTSMASPAACGALAALLSRSAAYQALTGTARAEEARAILAANCQSIGLAAGFQGRGIPRVQ